jgi:Tol biopolymer transport system component
MQLTQPPDYVVNPRWSPDSKEIVFTTESPDGRYSIRRISAADGTTLWFVPKQSADTADPNWSPDGTKVLYNTAKEQVINAPSVDLRIVDLKSRQVMVISGSAGKWSPRWSPDGRFIAALLSPQVNHLPVFDVKLQRWFDLPVNGIVEFPNFSHDGKFIYFLRAGQDQGVFRIPVTGGREERVVDLNGWHLTSVFGSSSSMSLDPTDAPLVLRDTGTDDIYALTLEP